MKRLEFAKKIAREAGELTLRYFYNHEHVIVERKSDESPVTVADREAENLLRQRISEQFPDDAILGEEFPNREGHNDFRWILDPIDGTKSFIHGVPIYSTLIGIEQNGVSMGGVIALPALSELVWAGRGLGAWHETTRFEKPIPAKVSNCRKINEALFLTSEVLTFDKSDRQNSYKRLERNVCLTRTWGDAYGYFLVATGRAEIMVDPILSDWDAGPLLVILEEAGGRFTDWKGTPTISGKEGVGTNGFLHDNVLRILNET
ncbi:MAG: histidinol-phosphatase [Planctomycetaceae bacterium]|jgi:histidinol phosphatase-like enzyme (inositol monophosphatase family)|nr:histidinol-phosphatase [Planctomycetaceae bacterium]